MGELPNTGNSANSRRQPNLKAPAPRTRDGKPHLSGLWGQMQRRKTYRTIGKRMVVILPHT